MRTEVTPYQEIRVDNVENKVTRQNDLSHKNWIKDKNVKITSEKRAIKSTVSKKLKNRNTCQ